jgi:alpha-beta hydrolase superfamily lysophospholipase
MTHFTTSTVTDGSPLAIYDWAAAPSRGTVSRGTVLIVHGLGEHAGRYAPIAGRLNALGWSVRAYDQYGHGESARLGAGRPGALARPLQLPEHLAAIADATRVARQAPGPLIVLGHSLGGLVAASAVSRGLLRPDGLVLSSPALAVDMAAWQRAAVGWLPRLAPDLTLGNGLKPEFLSHDPAVVAAYQADPLVHDRICARLGAFVAQEGEQVCAAAARWSVPTLLLYAGDDRLVSPRGSRAFAATAEAAGAPVQSRCFGTLYHEIFNEPEPADPGDSPFKALATWLDARG